MVHVSLRANHMPIITSKPITLAIIINSVHRDVDNQMSQFLSTSLVFVTIIDLSIVLEGEAAPRYSMVGMSSWTLMLICVEMKPGSTISACVPHISQRGSVSESRSGAMMGKKHYESFPLFLNVGTPILSTMQNTTFASIRRMSGNGSVIEHIFGSGMMKMINATFSSCAVSGNRPLWLRDRCECR